MFYVQCFIPADCQRRCFNNNATWDIPLVLDELCRPPFEPLAQVELKWLTWKTAFLLAISSAKHISELRALSVSESCLIWILDGSGVTLWLNTAFLPKVLSCTHLNQAYLASTVWPSLKGERGWACTVQCRHWGSTLQLLHAFGGLISSFSVRGLRQWASNCLLPSGVRCHFTRSAATSWAALRGISLEDICSAASWVSPDAFSRFNSVNVAAPHLLAVVPQPVHSEGL